MANQLLYRLPADCEVVAKVAQAIPSNWRGVRGYLSATRMLYDRDQVAVNTHLEISRHSSVTTKIVGAVNVPYEDVGSITVEQSGVIVPRIYDVFLGGKLVSSASFFRAEYGRSGAFTSVRPAGECA